MARGPKKHLKRLTAPKHWMLDKMGGAWAPRPSTGPHKLRECLPVILILRNRLKYALNRREVQQICMEKLVQVDGKVRTDPCFPAGFMDVVTLGPKEKRFDANASIDRFRLLFDVKGRFVLHPVSAAEAKFKLCKVVRQQLTQKKIPYIVTHDGRTIRYPDPKIRVGDTVTVDIESGKITSFTKYDVGTLVMCVKGRNAGRIGYLVNRERHPGSFTIINIKDATGNVFATREENIFVIGEAGDDFTAKVTLPKAKGIKLSILEERKKMFKDL
jgi:small subunit ribosomal protein S4e